MGHEQFVGKISPKRKRFCEEYVIDHNKTQAAIRAGYSKKTASQQGERLCRFVECARYIKHLEQRISDDNRLSAQQALDDMFAIRNMKVSDILDDKLHIKPVSEWPDIWQMYVSGVDIKEMYESGTTKGEVTMAVLKKLKWPDKQKNLEMISKHFGLFEKDNLQRRPEHMTEAEIDAEIAAIEAELNATAEIHPEQIN